MWETQTGLDIFYQLSKLFVFLFFNVFNFPELSPEPLQVTVFFQ